MTMARLTDVALFLLVAATLWSLDTVAGAGTNPLEIVRYGIILGLAAVIFAIALIESHRRPLSLRLSTGGALLAVFLVYTALSVFWSAGGTQSVLKTILLVTIVSTALVVVTLRPIDAIVRVVVAVCGAFVVLGAMTAIFVPSVGVETGWLLEGKWRGLSSQKNGYGALVAISLVYAVVQLTLPQDTSRRRGLVLLTLAWSGFLIVCLLMAGSRGAQLAAFLGIAGLVFTRLSRSVQNLVLFCSLLLMVPLAILASLTFSANSTELSVFGLTFDTSSRTQIWSYGLELLAGRELFGFGPSGFWTPERSEVFKADNGWVLDNFHSGYVTALMEGGIVGLLLLLAALAASFALLRSLATRGDRYVTFAFAFFCIVVAQNLVENTFGRSTDFQFFAFLLLVFAASTVAPGVTRRHGTPISLQSHAEASYG